MPVRKERKKRHLKENVEVQEVLVHRIPCEKPAGEGGHWVQSCNSRT